MRTILIICAFFGGLAGIVFFLNGGCNQTDYMQIKFGFNPIISGDTSKAKPSKDKTASATGELAKEPEERELVKSRERATEFLQTATHDYYSGNFSEALRRLERAKWHNPYSYNVFRLSGQIFYEQNRFRKAFDDWSRAVQLPNDDVMISRDFDVLKKILRYNRNEMDRLQRHLNKKPDDRVSLEQLRELDSQMRD